MNSSRSSDSGISMVLVTRKPVPPQFLDCPEPYSAPRCFASTGFPTRKTLQGVFVTCTKGLSKQPLALSRWPSVLAQLSIAEPEVPLMRSAKEKVELCRALHVGGQPAAYLCRL